MLAALDLIAEKYIVEAILNGTFDNLPGAGRPLDLDYDPLIPAEVRMAYRILKNAGLAPPEVTARREIGQLIAFIGGETNVAERTRALRRLELLRLRLAAARGCEASLAIENAYFGKLLECLQGTPGRGD